MPRVCRHTSSYPTVCTDDFTHKISHRTLLCVKLYPTAVIQTPFSTYDRRRANPVVRAVPVTDAAEAPHLQPGQIAFVEALRPPPFACNYYEQVFAVQYQGRVLVRHMSLMMGRCHLFAGNRDFDGPVARAEVRSGADGWLSPVWHLDGRLTDDLRLLGPVVSPYEVGERLLWNREPTRTTPEHLIAWAN